ncbi:MAG: glycoside hydrolase family 9 protein, partial [Acidimicrobiia bacterium]|nr:glycoside hydrolase family 9 protein [Acidimicrobiia bacterium]
ISYDFDQPPEGDDVSGFPATLFGPREVSRDGEPFGRAVADGDDLLRTYDRLLGRPIDVAALVAGRWTISSVDDPGFATPVAAAEVLQVTRPAGNGLGPGNERFTPLVHDVILRLPSPVRLDGTYLVEPPVGLVDPIEVTFDPLATISPAVHVNQNGYRPDDPVKIGYLAGYVDDLGRPGYREGIVFRVIESGSGDVAYEGTTTRRPGGDELGQGDLTGAPAFELDFSPLLRRGLYRVCVEEVGCSEEFEVDDRVWDELTVAIARSMYHQRSGLALGPPYTAVARPRPYHPDDGLVVVESEYRLLDSIDDAANERFDELAARRTDRVVSEAWGGHFDAGDWDRRIEHLYYVRAVAELVERHPARFGELTLGIPESTNAIPDLLDEGLWTLDLFRRLQRPDGAIPGGIEAAEHPLPNTTSWTDPLAVFTYEPDPFSTYLYAGVAAQVAATLGPYAPGEAERYLGSAEAAMAWAEAQPDEPDHTELVQAHRSVAAVALFKATGDERWHDLFRQTTTLGRGVDPFLSCHQHTRCDAGWVYLTIDPAVTDPDLRRVVEESFVATADEIVSAAEGTAFGWTLENRFVPLIWGLGVGGAPGAVGLMRAYELTGDERYLGAAQRSAAVSLGANPTNTVFVTGIGRHPVRHPLIVDTLHGGLPVWAGTPVYGHHRLDTVADEAWVEEFVLGPAGIDPLPTELPYLWQWMDVPDVPMFNEFTVFQSHGQAIYAFGLLAAANRA